MRTHKIKICFVILALIFSPLITKAQVSKTLVENPSKVKSSQVSDAQLKVIMQRALEAGMTPEQIEALARSRGMSEIEIEKFKERAERLYENKADNQKDGRIINPVQVIDYPEPFNKRYIQDTIKELNFGFSLFRNSDLTFEPSFNIAPPKNYIIGPTDILNIDVWGESQQTYQEVVSNTGEIVISKLGPIIVSGLSIEEANIKLKNKLSKIYAGINERKTFVKVSLGSVRSIRVNIVGEVILPGTYNLSSLASVFNAMYAAGGPSKNGSLRDVKVIRGNKIVAEIDFYEYLLKGKQTGNIRLEDQDVIFVSPYARRVYASGALKRSLQFDIKENETLNDLIYFAGGFKGNAYTKRIKIYRKTGKEKKILDFSHSEWRQAYLYNGDKIIVDSVLNRFQNRVQINGAIMRPGVYAIDSMLTLKELIEKAEGLREDVYKHRISVFRLTDDLARENIPVDLKQLMNSNLDFPLQREDSIVIPSIYDLREYYTFKIEGEIRNPGVYPYAENTTVEDLIIQSGGLLETASLAYVEIARRLKDEKSTNTKNELTQIFRFPLDKNLKLDAEGSTFILQPYDYVFVRPSPAYSPQLIVSIEGEVNFPGKYSITTRKERISDLIKRAGNITSEAYIKGASLIRKKTDDKILTDKAIETIASEKEVENKIQVSEAKYDLIGVELEEILKNPGGPNDLILQEGDSIRILKQTQTVKVSGAVYSPNVIPYFKNFTLRDYILNAGGYTKEAKQGHIYVVYANGSIKKTKNVIFFANHPNIEPGAEIIVPTKKEKRQKSMTETLSISSALASLALLIVTIINSLK